jgi:WD40 repeat protein
MKEGWVGSVAFSPDGKTIAAGYSSFVAGGGAVLWDAAGRKRLAEQPLAVKESGVGSVAFSPDGKTIAAGCGALRGGGVVLWDATGRERLAEQPLAVDQDSFGSVAFSPDGKTVAAVCGRGMVLWDVDLDSWQRIAGQIANRDFTSEERHQYLPEKE